MARKRSPARRSRRVAAGEFKAKCLALFDEINVTGEELVVTKRGRPVARVLPAHEDGPRTLLGSVRSEKDIVAPTGEGWQAEA